MYMCVRTWVICVHARAFHVCAFVYVHVCVCRAYLCLYINFQFFDGCQSIRQLSLEFRNIILVIGTQFFILVSHAQSILQLCLEFRNICLCIGKECFGLVARVQSSRELFLEFGNIFFGIGEELYGLGVLNLMQFQ